MVPTWLRQELLMEALILRVFVSGILLFIALVAVWSIATNRTTLTTAYPLLALASSGLIGLGFVRKGQLNLSAILGTLVAIVAASFAVAEFLKSELASGTWRWLTIALAVSFFLVAMVIIQAFARMAMVLEPRKTDTLNMFLLWIGCHTCIAAVLFVPLVILVATAN